MWTFNSVRIIVQGLSGASSQVIARLQPLSGGTVTQIFGYETDIHKLSGLVVGDTDLGLLKDLDKTGLSYVLAYNSSTVGTYYVKSFSYARDTSLYQSIRTDLDCTSPVYAIEMELYE